MGRSWDTLAPPVAEAVAGAPMFFVATAPLGLDGHVNVSPKGGDTIRVLDERTVAYLDLTGSGVETVAHLRENGRITIMVCAFEGPAQIVRLYGRGEVVLHGDERFEALAAAFPPLPGVRSVIVVTLERVTSSCGYGVPIMRHEAERTRLFEWAEAKGPDGLAEYRALYDPWQTP